MNTKVKFFWDEYQCGLEKKVNEFLQGKNILNISYSTNSCGHSI